MRTARQRLDNTILWNLKNVITLSAKAYTANNTRKVYGVFYRRQEFDHQVIFTQVSHRNRDRSVASSVSPRVSNHESRPKEGEEKRSQDLSGLKLG